MKLEARVSFAKMLTLMPKTLTDLCECLGSLDMAIDIDEVT